MKQANNISHGIERRFRARRARPLFTLALILWLLTFLGCETSKLEPVALVPEDMCSYCRMAISDERYAAELINSEGQTFKFDDIGCLANFIQNKKSNTKTVAYFVMDFDERTWVKAEDAYYVRSAEVSTPMNGGVIAFQNRERAQQAVDKYDGQLLQLKDVLNL